MATLQLNDANLAKLTDYLAVKQPPRVIKQTPPAGTPVIAGMTIEVQTVSYSDVPYYVLDANAPAAVRNIPIADLEKVVSEDATLTGAVTSGTPADPATFAAKLSTGLAGRGIATTISTTDATAVAKSFNAIGMFRT